MGDHIVDVSQSCDLPSYLGVRVSIVTPMYFCCTSDFLNQEPAEEMPLSHDYNLTPPPPLRYDHTPPPKISTSPLPQSTWIQ